MDLYAAALGSGSYLSVGSDPAYDFWIGDFSVAAMVMMDAGGPVVSRIDQQGGFSLTVNPDSSITFLTSDGSVTYQLGSGPTLIFDGACHTLVAIRQGVSMQILFDGVVLHSGAGGPPLNVNNSSPILIGANSSDQKLVGMVMNVGVWNCALQGDQIVQASFAHNVQENETLRGYWTLDNTFADLSPNNNGAVEVGSVAFLPCVSCVWTSGANGYDFCQMSVGGAQGESISQVRAIQVEEGVPALFFSIMSDGDQPAFPAGSYVMLIDPANQVYDQDTNSDGVFVLTQDGQPWAVAVVNPQAGHWVVSVTAPPSVGFVLQLQTCPTSDVVQTIEDALYPLYGPAPGIAEGDVTGWLSVLVQVAVAVVVGVAVAAITVLSGGTAIPAILYGLMAFASVTYVEANVAIGQLDHNDLYQASMQVGGMAGFLVSPDMLLLIDANTDDDNATLWIYEAREEYLYPAVTTSIFNKNQKRIIGQDDKRDKVEEALLSFNGGYVTAGGHGQSSILQGWYKEGNSGPLAEVLRVGKYDPAEVAGKIIHMLACDCGYSLGLDVVDKGAVAFFGYSDKFINLKDWHREFCRPDIEIDLALMGQATCEEAYQAAIAVYNSKIGWFQGRGDVDAASFLRKDRDRLVAPSTDPRYGDKNARLAGPRP
ncbi:LamG domain-containing protein [Kitasatospora sp. NPDC052896]|uniref:LamG domain-containing protein n=1 Tax=Kitasatospora sp. NPDC052896 TaxID=3364061 RepID=UPI0037C9FF59